MKEKNKIDRETIKRFVVVVRGLGLVFGFGPAAHTATPSLQPETSSGFQFTADAYGTYANVGNVIIAGKTAVSSLGACGIVSPPVHSQNTVVSADASPLFTTGVINTTADGTEPVTGTLQALARAHVFDARRLPARLGGLIPGAEDRAAAPLRERAPRT